jgi:hypothetical protein
MSPINEESNSILELLNINESNEEIIVIVQQFMSEMEAIEIIIRDILLELEQMDRILNSQ